MMNLKLVKYPNAILSKKLRMYDFNSPAFDLPELKKEMTVIMLANNGIGLSACQVGLDYQIMIMGKEDNVEMMINPVIEDESTVEETHLEGCLSFPGIYVPVTRPNWVEISYYNELGELQNYELQGYDAKVFYHEYDHLNGITFNKRVSNLKWQQAKKRSKKVA